MLAPATFLTESLTLLEDNFLAVALTVVFLTVVFLTVAGAAVETLLRSIHNVVLAANKMNEMLTNKLNGELSIEDSNTVIGIMDNLNKKTAELPNIMKALNTAKENLLYEEEQQTARGGVTILSSMTEE